MSALRSLGSRLRWRVGVIVAAAMLLVACGSGDGSQEGQPLPDYDPQPQSVDAPVPEANKDELRVPLQLIEQPVLAPSWQTPPHGVDDVFLSAEHNEDVLTFRAVDTEGTVLWETERPLSCTGFTLTTADETSYAVLTDIEADVQSFGHTVAAAYDLHTGEQAWGPVDVPGPHQGPGTVFAAPPEEAMGSTGPKVVLDPATGDVLVDERENPDVQILGEFHGIVLLVEGGQVHAYQTSALAEDGASASSEWSISLDEYEWNPERLAATSPTPNPGVNDGTGAVLIGTNNADRALVTLEEGDVIADQLADAGQDPVSGTWVAIGEDHFTGYGPDHQVLYEESAADLELAGIGGAIAYVRNANGDIEARNVTTGEIGRSYDPQDTGQLTVPITITATGASVLEAEGTYYFVPTNDMLDTDS